MEKTRQVSEEALKSQVNVAKSTQGAKARSRGYFRGRGQGNYRNRGRRNINQGRDNNFRALTEGRGVGNFGVGNQGRGQGNNYQG